MDQAAAIFMTISMASGLAASLAPVRPYSMAVLSALSIGCGAIGLAIGWT